MENKMKYNLLYLVLIIELQKCDYLLSNYIGDKTILRIDNLPLNDLNTSQQVTLSLLGNTMSSSLVTKLVLIPLGECSLTTNSKCTYSIVNQ